MPQEVGRALGMRRLHGRPPNVTLVDVLGSKRMLLGCFRRIRNWDERAPESTDFCFGYVVRRLLSGAQTPSKGFLRQALAKAEARGSELFGVPELRY